MQTVRYFDTGDLDTLQMLCAIRENSSLRELIAKSHYLLSPEQFTQSFQENYPESLDNLKQLSCRYSLRNQYRLKLPRFNPERPAVESIPYKTEQARGKRLNSLVYKRAIVKSCLYHPPNGFDYF